MSVHSLHGRRSIRKARSFFQKGTGVSLTSGSYKSYPSIIAFPLKKHKSKTSKSRVISRFRACLQHYLFCETGKKVIDKWDI